MECAGGRGAGLAGKLVLRGGVSLFRRAGAGGLAHGAAASVAAGGGGGISGDPLLRARRFRRIAQFLGGHDRVVVHAEAAQAGAAGGRAAGNRDRAVAGALDGAAGAVASDGGGDCLARVAGLSGGRLAVAQTALLGGSAGAVADGRVAAAEAAGMGTGDGRLRAADGEFRGARRRGLFAFRGGRGARFGGSTGPAAPCRRELAAGPWFRRRVPNIPPDLPETTAEAPARPEIRRAGGPVRGRWWNRARRSSPAWLRAAGRCAGQPCARRPSRARRWRREKYRGRGKRAARSCRGRASAFGRPGRATAARRWKARRGRLRGAR